MDDCDHADQFVFDNVKDIVREAGKRGLANMLEHYAIHEGEFEYAAGELREFIDEFVGKSGLLQIVPIARGDKIAFGVFFNEE